MDHLGLVNDGSVHNSRGENTTPKLEPLSSPPRHEVPNNDDPAQSQGKGCGFNRSETHRAEVAAATPEPIPSTSKGATVDTQSKASDGTEDSSGSERMEAVTIPTLSVEDLLKLHPTPKKVPKKEFPEEAKNEKYNAMRLKNTISSRDSRAKKRRIDAERVALLKKAMERNQQLKEECQRLKKIAKNSGTRKTISAPFAPSYVP